MSYVKEQMIDALQTDKTLRTHLRNLKTMVRYGLSLIVISYCLWRNNWLLPWGPELIYCKHIWRFLKMVSTCSRVVGARDVRLINLLSCRYLINTQFSQLKLTNVAKWTTEDQSER